MSSKAKIKGTQGEVRVVKYLKEHGFEAQRRALEGRNDSGDVECITNRKKKYIIEVKSGEQTIDTNRKMFQKWIDQSIVEAGNYSKSAIPVLIVAKHRRSVKDYDVYVTIKCQRIHMYFDEFCDYLETH